MSQRVLHSNICWRSAVLTKGDVVVVVITIARPGAGGANPRALTALRSLRQGAAPTANSVATAFGRAFIVARCNAVLPRLVVAAIAAPVHQWRNNTGR